MNYLGVFPLPEHVEENWRELERERQQQRQIQEARAARRAARPSRIRRLSRRGYAARCSPTRALNSPKAARPGRRARETTAGLSAASTTAWAGVRE